MSPSAPGTAADSSAPIVYPVLPGRPALPPRAAGPLRILIVSTPKTGNTWLKLLLSEIYSIPVVDLPEHPGDIRLDQMPESWVGQQHYWMNPALVEWADRHGIFRFTTVRHPGDVLVSLWHHVRKRGGQPNPDRRQAEHLLLDGDRLGEAALEYVGQGLYRDLHVSITWLRAGGTFGVRYEDLWQRPWATLEAITRAVRPCEPLVRQRAYSLCQIGALQAAGRDSGTGFFRQGGVGGWRGTLTPAMKEALRTWDPYPAQLAYLGYTMDEAENERLEASAVEANPDPFRGALRFAHGVPVARALVECYYALRAAGVDRWPDPIACDAGCYFDWLVSPAAADPRPGATPVITELAMYLRSVRPDVQAAFPDPFGADRFAFANWFAYTAADEFRLDHHLVLPVFRSWALPGAGG